MVDRLLFMYHVAMEQVRNNYKRKFGYGEFYRILLAAMRAMPNMAKNRRQGVLSPQFLERIMLAVTEVNGCAACSYAHTRMALKEGLDSSEIAAMLSGNTGQVPVGEAKAIMFSQHFAEAKGLPERTTFNLLVDEYGYEKAQAILSAAQVILFGNAYGIPFSAFISRIKGTPYRDSSPWYELSMLFLGVLCVPIALLHMVVLAVAKQPNIRFGIEG